MTAPAPSEELELLPQQSTPTGSVPRGALGSVADAPASLLHSAAHGTDGASLLGTADGITPPLLPPQLPPAPPSPTALGSIAELLASGLAPPESHR